MNVLRKKLSILFLSGSLFMGIPACGQKEGKNVSKYYKEVSGSSLASTNDSLFYSLGFNMGSEIKSFFKTNRIDKNFDMDIYLKGFLEAYLDKNGAFASIDESKQFFYMAMQKVQEKVSEMTKQEGVQFFAENKTKPGVKEVPNGEGIQYMVIKSGSGAQPKLEDTVECHYIGTLLDGTEFDNSIKRGQPAIFPLGGVIKGWQLSLAQMKVGDKWKIFVPSELGYGSRGAGGTIPSNATLVFEVELLKVMKAVAKK